MADIDNKEPSELDQDLDDVKKVEEEETGEETKIKAHQLTFQMMQNPQILQLFKKDLMEVHNLERKYAVLCQPLFDKWFEIINAIYEPTEEISEELKEKAKIEDEKKDEEKEDAKGMPEFWLIVFKNVDLLSDIESMLQERDEPILKHLEDIKVKFSDAGQPTSFVLEFHFETNEYFKNEVLTKTYRMRSEPDDSDPFYFDGPETMGFTGCQIDWKKERIDKGRGTVRTLTKTVSNDSFFNFFFSESGDLDDAAEAILAADFEIGHFLPECIIRGSVLYFTGEATEDDDDYDEEGEEKEMRKTIQTTSQRRIKIQQSTSSNEAGCMWP
uniref:Nucleosome assembly protein 1 like 1 n=1 Tax=Rhinopithecus roxellana TaxID=61622 RepID=A0A2K6NXL7_RHIRO